MKLEDVYNQFPTKNNCIEYLENIRWTSNPICPYCNSSNFTGLKEERRYHCNTCNISYSVTVGTPLHKTKIDLQKWFYAIHLIFSSTEKISSRRLAKEIEVTKDTAWRIIKQIKIAILEQNQTILKISKL